MCAEIHNVAITASQVPLTWDKIFVNPKAPQSAVSLPLVQTQEHFSKQPRQVVNVMKEAINTIMTATAKLICLPQ